MMCHCLGCPDPGTHITSEHVCPVCYQKGHGHHECGPGLRARLRRTDLDRAPSSVLAPELQCEYRGCMNPSTHTTLGHACFRCGNRQTLCLCPREPVISLPPPPTYLKGIKCPICRTTGTANLFVNLFTGSQCIICKTESKLCSIMPCGHAQCCKTCLMEMTLPST